MIKFASITNNSKNVVLLVSCDYINKKIRTKVSYVYVLRQCMYETKTAIIKCTKSFKQDLNKNDVVYSKYTFFLSYIFLYHCLVIQIENISFVS